jgi:hypothetical protein
MTLELYTSPPPGELSQPSTQRSPHLRVNRRPDSTKRCLPLGKTHAGLTPLAGHWQAPWLNMSYECPGSRQLRKLAAGRVRLGYECPGSRQLRKLAAGRVQLGYECPGSRQLRMLASGFGHGSRKAQPNNNTYYECGASAVAVPPDICTVVCLVLAFLSSSPPTSTTRMARTTHTARKVAGAPALKGSLPVRLGASLAHGSRHGSTAATNRRSPRLGLGAVKRTVTKPDEATNDSEVHDHVCKFLVL